MTLSMFNLVEDPKLRNRVFVFENRAESGRLLGNRLKKYKSRRGIILAIPSGGVPVAKEIQNILSLDLDLIIARKTSIPWNPEAGFGAVNLDGDIVLNKELVQHLMLTDDTIDQQVGKTVNVLREREEKFRKKRDFPDISNRPVIMVDDGLASGYTMRASLQFVKKRKPSEIIIAVPTGSFKTIKALISEVDSIYCLNIREGFPFAVADAYRVWDDLSDEDVITILKI